VLESLPKRRLHVPDAIRAVMHVGAAVHYLHRSGYLYRDLKPANVLLREGIPILVDFDVVRKIEPTRRPGGPPRHRAVHGARAGADASR
jgi:serine/threonine protein kinase